MLRFSSFWIFAVLAGWLAHSVPAQAQTWKVLGNFPGMNFRCAYFWDTAHGVVAGDNHIFYYRSGVWKESAYPEATAIFRSLRLLDGKNLYAASGATCIWKSTDSGATWELTKTMLPNADDIYLDPGGSINGMNISGTGMMKGTTFATTNGMNCIVARDDVPTLTYSNDGGTTWTSARSEINSGYSCVADPCTGKFYAMTDGIKFQLWQSTDAGRDWTMLRDFVTEGTDNLAGGNWGILYVQGVRDIYRFTPWNGWQNLNWPDLGAGDRRMFSFGPIDNYLISMNGGRVWLWDAGDIATPWRKPLVIKDSIVEGCYPPLVDTVGIIWPAGIDTLFVCSDKNSGATIRPDTLKLTPYSRPPIFTIHMVPGEHSGVFPIHAWAYYECDTVRWDTSFSIELAPRPSLSLTNSIHVLGCSDTLIPIWITAPSCDSIVTLSAICSDSSGIFTLPDTTQGWVIPNGSKRAIWVGVHGSHPGTYRASFEVVLQSKGTGITFDTVMELTVSVSNRRAPVRVSIPSPLVLSNCNGSRVPIIVRAHPCADLLLEQCSLTIDPSAQYAKNFSLPARIAAGTSDTFFIAFPSRGLQKTYALSVSVSGVYADTPYLFDTTLHAFISFNSSTGALASNVVSIVLDTVNVCSESDTVVTLTNVGCNAITVTGNATAWQPGWSAVDPAFPFTLAPDSSFEVRVHYTPYAPASTQQLLSYSFTDIDGNKVKSLPLSLAITSIPAPARLLLLDTAVNLGTFARCTAAGDTIVSFTNAGCDSISLSGAALATGTGFTLVSGGDTVLAPNQSVYYAVHFSDSVVGTLTSTLHLHAVGAHGGRAFDTTIALSAIIVPGTKLATLRPTSIDFGTTSICEEREDSITITNIGCEADTIRGISFANAAAASSASFPIVIPPGGMVTIPVLTVIDTIGHRGTNTDTLQIFGNLDDSLPPVILSRGITYPGGFALSIAAEGSAPVKAMVPVYVLRKGTIPAAASELDFDLVYDNDLLSYEHPVQSDIHMKHASLLPNGLTERTFAMQPASDRDTIATLLFQSYLAKHTATPITLTGQKFLADGETSPPCVASLDTNATDTGFTLELTCTQGPISEDLQGLPFAIIQINATSNQLDFSIARGDARYASCRAEVLNVLGAEEFSKQFTLGPVTNGSFDMHSLSAGTYFLRVSSGGYVATRQFVLLK